LVMPEVEEVEVYLRWLPVQQSVVMAMAGKALVRHGGRRPPGSPAAVTPAQRRAAPGSIEKERERGIVQTGKSVLYTG